MEIRKPKHHQRFNKKEMLLFGSLMSVRYQLLPNSKLNCTVGGYVPVTKGHAHIPVGLSSAQARASKNCQQVIADCVIFSSFLCHVLAIQLQKAVQCRLICSSGLCHALPGTLPLRTLQKANRDKEEEKQRKEWEERRINKCWELLLC